MKAKALLILAILPLFALAQNKDEIKYKNFSIGTVPQYSLINGMRLDMDFRLTKNGHWLIVAPQFYLNNNSDAPFDADYKEKIGAGVAIFHRKYFNTNPNPDGAYFAYGPTFNFFNVKEDGYVNEPYIDNGSRYYRVLASEIETKLYTYGGNMLVGYQSTIYNSLYLDLFLGTGIRFSFDSQNSGLSKKFGGSFLTMGYSGTLVVAGFRLGFTF